MLYLRCLSCRKVINFDANKDSKSKANNCDCSGMLIFRRDIDAKEGSKDK